MKGISGWRQRGKDGPKERLLLAFFNV